MAYTNVNYPTKKALKEDFKLGMKIEVFQPGGVFPPKVPDGRAYLEGPHYPKPHTWYATVDVVDGVITKIVG